MNTNLSSLIDAFKSLKVLVIGEAMLDRYLEGTADRLCQEAPVPIVNVRHCQDVPGGAANTAVNLRSLGSQPVFLSVVGGDPEWDALKQTLTQQNILTEYVLVHPTRRTLTKQRILAASQLLLRFDQGSTNEIDTATEQALINHLIDLFPQSDAVLVSDYGYGVLTPRIIQALADLQARSPRVLVIDARNLAAYRSVKPTAVKPNYKEALQLLGSTPSEFSRDRVEQITASGKRLLEITGAQIVAATLDAEGAIVFERDSLPYRTYAHSQTGCQVTGAGDTYASTLTLALASRAILPTAAELAAAAAAIVVAKEGTAICSVHELQGFFAIVNKHIPHLSHLVNCVAFYRQQGRRVIFTNGYFDLLHRGHITYLNQAKTLGDILIVGVNSDASTTRLKGAGRPINPLEDRVQMLAALSCVDHVIDFDQDIPFHLIEAIRPDVYVKGSNYQRELLPEAPLVEQLGGRVEILPYLPNRSTSGLIERIRAFDSPAPSQGNLHDITSLEPNPKLAVH